MTQEGNGRHPIKLLREKLSNALGHVPGIRRKASLNIAAATTSSELSHVDAVKAKLNVAIWSKPGVRHEGLSRENLLALNGQGYLVVQNDENIWVSHDVRQGYHYQTFDKNGRLIKEDSQRHQEERFLEYDHLGRVTRYTIHRIYDLTHAYLYRASYSYDSDENDTYSVQETSKDYYGLFGGP